MAIDYAFSINGKDFSQMVERDSYETTVTPIYSSALTTMDGVDHLVKVRDRGSVAAGLNPQSEADVADICDTLLAGPVEVFYHCLVRNMDRYATMIVDSLTARNLSRCRARGLKWHEVGTITLTEL